MIEEIIYLYHIRRDTNEGDLTKGYIGVSNNPEERYYHHKIKPNKNLKEAVSKKVIINYIEYSSISEASKTLGIERTNIGLRVKSCKWNNYQYKEEV